MSPGWYFGDGAFSTTIERLCAPLPLKNTPSYAHLLNGSHLADSWAIDGHKWLNVPYDSVYAFIAHPEAFSIAAIAQMEPRAMSFMHAMKERVLDRMDNGMKSAPMNGDVDHDFATMMMPHHQGAIDMAKAELVMARIL